MLTEEEIEVLCAQAHENVMVVVRESENYPHGQIRIDVAARREFRRIFEAGRVHGFEQGMPSIPKNV